jgi:sucrose phosphorylase
VQHIHRNARGQSKLASGHAANNVDLYQVNCTFFDALARKAEHYLLARAVQFFLPGIPQVYYVGLLAGENDMELLRQSGNGRDINRQRFQRADIALALAKPVVQQLIQLIRLRNSHRAFSGAFSLLASADDVLHLRWENAESFADLQVNFAAGQGVLSCSSDASNEAKQWHW